MFTAYSSDRKMFSSYTSVQGGEFSWKILLRVRWLAKKQFSFVLMMDASLLLRRSWCSESRYNIISIGALHGERFNFSSDYESFQRYQSEVSGRARKYLHVVKFRGYIWWIAIISALRLEFVEQSKTMMVSSLDIQFYPEDRLGLGGADTQQESSDHYSYVKANSHKSCMN